jgi:NAD(P)-dependent dehydrogenase (short-subunit alcohol dehydrogenase family)
VSPASPATRVGAVAVVTGASSGIGHRTCELLLDEGATVFGVDRDDPSPALSGYPRFAGVRADVSSAGAVAAAAERVRDEAGRCDVLVNSAGILVNGTATETTEETWDLVMSVNLRGAWLVCRAFIPLMAASGGGAIVSVASGTGLRPLPGLAAYSASKAGLVSLSRSVALDYAQAGIRSCCVCPGPTETPMFSNDERNAAVLEASGGVWPVPLAQPEEIARAILFLSSPANPRLTGIALAIDSGRTLH